MPLASSPATFGTLGGSPGDNAALTNLLATLMPAAGGAFTGLTGAGFRDTSAAFDVTQIFTSSTVLDAGRSITWDVKNSSHQLKFTAASIVTFPAGTNTLLGSAVANTIATNGAASTPALIGSGTIFTGGSATTTKPYWLIEPSGTTSTGWSTAGTLFGANGPSGFGGNLLDLQVAGVSKFKVEYEGSFMAGNYWQISGSTYFRHTSGRMIWTHDLGALQKLGFSGSMIGALDAFFARKAAAVIQLGEDAAGVTNQMLTAASRITSDGVGADLTIAGGNGRGGAGGSLILSTYDTAGAATIGTLRSRMTLDTAGLLTFADAVNLAFNDTTGTKIGTAATQKIGFWNATPVVQPTTGGATSSFSVNTGTPVLEDSTWDGYTISVVIAALRGIGILA